MVAAGDLTMKQRNLQLAEMTDEVGELCLRNNSLQNLALSLVEARAAGFVEAQQRLMRKLEQAGRLNREIEELPDDPTLDERRRAGRGLARPEAAVLLAYAKMTLYSDILASDLPDRPYFAADLAKYFPRPLRRRFADDIAAHRLRREIVATWLANSVVNRGLDVFVSELEDETGARLDEICLGYVITRDAFKLLPLWAAIAALPREVPASLADRDAERRARDAGPRHALVPRAHRAADAHRHHGGGFRAGDRTVAGRAGGGARRRTSRRCSQARSPHMSRPASTLSWRAVSQLSPICWRRATSSRSPVSCRAQRHR